MKRIALLSLAVISFGTVSLFGQQTETFGQTIKAAIAKSNPAAAQAWENHEQTVSSIRANIQSQLSKPGANVFQVLGDGARQLKEETEKFRTTVEALKIAQPAQSLGENIRAAVQQQQATTQQAVQKFGENLRSAAEAARARAAAAGQQPTFGETMRSIAQGSQS